MDLLIIIATIHISKQNHRRRRICNRRNVTLSDRYQTAENLRYLQFLIPTAYLTTACIFVGIGALLFSVWYKYSIVIPICLTKTNGYVVIMTGMWYYEVFTFKKERCKYNSNLSLRQLTAVAAGEDHFNMLKTMWK
uniref:Transmembrane protein n=1 Tax=Panagrellus redivivus TaxID=6233 RepID=A0A7E4UZ05_PANRE